MKKNIFSFVKQLIASHGQTLRNVAVIYLCVLLAGQKMIAQSNQKKAAAVNGLSLQIPGLPADAKDITWDRLPLLKGDRITVFEGKENVSAFCHHATIFYFGDQFFASWSNGEKEEDFSGQRVLYATSKDGYKWSKAVDLTGSIPERAYTPCGFWVRNGELFALASLDDSRGSTLTSPDNRNTFAYRWNKTTSAFQFSDTIIKNFYAIEGPRQVADGEWLLFGKAVAKKGEPATQTIQYARGGRTAMNVWDIKPLPDDDVAHDISWYALANGSLMSIEAKGKVPNRRLAALYSSDDGRSWSAPELSNFPDADSRLYSLRLSNGRYVLLNNPNLARYRNPLSIALSADGKKYDRLANIRIEQTNKKYPGHAKAPGYQYMRAIEHGGKLWIIYSVNKEDIEITAVSLAEIERFYAAPESYDNRKPAVEMIIDNGDKGFTTNRTWPTDTAAGVYDGALMKYYGKDYAYMNKTQAPGSDWAKWTPTITRPGVYSIYIKWAATGFGTRSPMAEVAPIEIKDARGVHRSSLDQTRYGGSWMYLGSFTMNAGTGSYVKIFSGTTGITVADAVKFVKME